ncbi:MAG: cyclopropane-fatty-acyl-phospholipid synthase family protein [Hyphomicrobiales bacterium]
MVFSLLNFENLLTGMLQRAIRTGTLNVHYPSGEQVNFGNGENPVATVHFQDAEAVRSVYFDPALKFAEMYMDGRMTIDSSELDRFIEIVKINGAKKFATPPAVALSLWRVVDRFWRRRIAPEKAQRNVAHHYDLDDRLFKLFLDDDLQYSCAYFETPDASLEEAQSAKKRHISAKMMLEEGQRVLDIGCGWGGTGLFLAQNFDVDVTGVTLSIEQQRVAQQRAQDLGLSESVRFNLTDYREVEGTFDRLVSIGMFEHVGPQNFIPYFKTAKKLMKDDGVFVLHSIGRAKPNAFDPPFVEKYIFPNGHIPCLSETLRSIEKSGLLVKDIEILTYHYADTLKHWRERFNANRDKVLELYDERFFRMWDLYLATSEVSFRHGKLFNFQIQVVKKQSTAKPTRNYIHENEEKLRKNSHKNAA